MRNSEHAPDDSSSGKVFYLGFVLSLIVVLGSILYFFSWLRSEMLLSIIGLHFISFLFFSVTYVRNKEFTLSHVLWGAIYSWVLPSILIYGVLFMLNKWAASMDSAVFGMWAFVAGSRSTWPFSINMVKQLAAPLAGSLGALIGRQPILYAG